MQLVNQNCVICNDRIRSKSTAKFCDWCGSPVHRTCLLENAESFEGTEGRCKVCGGDPKSITKRRVHGVLTVPGILVLLLSGGVGAALMQVEISGYRAGWIFLGIAMAIGATIADRCFGFEVTVRKSPSKN